MSSTRPGFIRRALRGFWQFVDGLRRFTINALFLLLVALVLVAWLGGGKPRPADNTALVIDLRGDLVEQYSGSAREAEFARSLGGEARETQLRDLVAVLDAAAKDPKIVRVVLLLDDLGRAGMPKLHEAAAALDRFRAAGKQVVAWAESYPQRAYLLAAHADEVYLHPMGEVELRGFGGYRNYYRDGLDKLGITVNVFRVGRFKSAVEPFVDNAASKEAQEADAYWLKDAWSGYVAEVEHQRKLPAGAVAGLIDELPARLAAAGGDPAALALREKLVDGIKTRDQLRTLLIERGAADAEHKTFRQVDFDSYLDGVADPGDRHRQVGVVVAEGEISDDEQPQGRIGGRSTAELLRLAREDDSIKAVVLRVDSPGGSVLGSELIRRELELARKAGKPVVVSMSDLAASGGYWISTAADAVFADPATITGSIGVFSLLPNVEHTLGKVGVHADGVGTTWLTSAGDPRRPLDPRFGAIQQGSVEHIYREFLARVAQARGSSPDKIDEIAQGRVWTGRQARERGLVDQFGGQAAAVADAARRAKLAEGYHVEYLEQEPKGWGRFLGLLPAALVKQAAQLGLGGLPAGALGQVAAVAGAGSDLARLQGSLQHPGQALVHCLCGAP